MPRADDSNEPPSTPPSPALPAPDPRIDSGYAWVRVAASLLLMTLGFSALYTIVVALKPVAADLGATRAGVSFAYAAMFIGFGFGGILMGWWSDRMGLLYPLVTGTILLSAGFLLAGRVTALWQLILVFGVLIGFGGISCTMGPLVANITHWFDRRRGIAVSIVISGSYVAGTVWPPIMQFGLDQMGWRDAWTGLGFLCLLTMLPLALVLRPGIRIAHDAAAGATRRRPLGFAPSTVQYLLCAAGLGCCTAMAVPQVHIVAHATDLGHAAARGAEMLSLVFFSGLISRITYGWVSDRIGGLRTLALGSAGQMIMLMLFLPVEGLTALYVVCILFGLSQGGIVPSYTIIARSCFSAGEVGWRIGWILLFTMLGMAFGGWMAGVLFDLTGNYDAALIAGVLFNLANLLIVAVFLLRARTPAYA